MSLAVLEARLSYTYLHAPVRHACFLVAASEEPSTPFVRLAAGNVSRSFPPEQAHGVVPGYRRHQLQSCERAGATKMLSRVAYSTYVRRACSFWHAIVYSTGLVPAERGI